MSIVQRTLMLVGSFLLATSFTLAGSLTATASATPVNNHVWSMGDNGTGCGGGPPGPCPGGGWFVESSSAADVTSSCGGQTPGVCPTWPLRP